VSGSLPGQRKGDQLTSHFARVALEARAKKRPLFAAFRFETTLRDALDVFAAAASGDRFYFEEPSRGFALAAAGEAARIETAGATRFADATSGVESVFAALRSGAADAAPPAPAEAGPILVGGFAFGEAPVRREGSFADFGALSFVLPAFAFVRVGARAWCTLSARIRPGDDSTAIASALAARAALLLAQPAAAVAAPSSPLRFGIVVDGSPDEYRRSVRRALDAIASGELEKVVLARACTVTRPDDFDAAHVLASLRAASRACIAFGVGRGKACFVGATPERLLRLERNRISTSALAGSAPRGRTPEEDERLAIALCESKKEQAEHAVVRRAIKAALVPWCEELRVPESPELLQLEGIQHLHTPIEGRLRPDARAGVLTLLERLHPTPAVSGAPRAPALRLLAACEPFDRGWYAGGVGWLTPNGDGEVAVALRCALLRGGHATLHAGAGIVEGSQPEAELEETRLKLRTALEAVVQL